MTTELSIACGTRADNARPMPEALPPGIVELSTSQGNWSGVDVSYAAARCSGSTMFTCEDHQGVRLVTLVQESGGRIEPRLHIDKPHEGALPPRSMVLMPAADPLFAYSEQIQSFRMFKLRFDVERIRELMATETLRAESFGSLRCFSDDRTWRIAALIADEHAHARPQQSLYIECLLTALFVELARRDPALAHLSRSRRLTPRQLRRVFEYIDSNVQQAVSLEALAELTGLSVPYFSSAFKASTGVPPYRWHLQARVHKAQQLLLDRESTLAQVALATGFADQSHFTRVFRQISGATPAAWRRTYTCLNKRH